MKSVGPLSRQIGALVIVERGAVTDYYKADRKAVVDILNEVLATELICMFRYKSHYYRASGINSQAVKPEFLQHAQEARQHAETVAARIVQLNGAPDFNPDGLTLRSRTEYSESATLTDMIREDLVSERIAVSFTGKTFTGSVMETNYPQNM